MSDTAIIILGGDISYRQPMALKLFFQLKAKEIFVVGDPDFYLENCDPDLVNKIQKYKDQNILNKKYTYSNSTYEDILVVKEILNQSDYLLLYIVTSDYHFRRVSMVLTRILNETELSRIKLISVSRPSSFYKFLKEKIKYYGYKLFYGL